MASYGVPYMGSKNGIAADIVNALPAGEVFYDLFAGGCAVTHAAMVSGKYKRFVANDIDWRGVTLFVDAINGWYHNERRLVDREYFHANKETDAYIALCWSFGNGGRAYLYGGDGTEAVKLAAQEMLMGETWQERRLLYRKFVKALMRHKDVSQLQQLQQLERLERLHSLLETRVGSYADVEIEGRAVVYCDPPYAGTAEYSCGAFDHEAFYEWLRTRDFPVYVSEYTMPDDFVRVWAKGKRVKLAGVGPQQRKEEGLFVHKGWADKIVRTEFNFGKNITTISIEEIEAAMIGKHLQTLYHGRVQKDWGEVVCVEYLDDRDKYRIYVSRDPFGHYLTREIVETLCGGGIAEKPNEWNKEYKLE